MLNRNRSVKRKFKPIAIESWFSYLTKDWESLFSDSCLDSARSIYTGGHIQEIELCSNDAIIHGTYQGTDFYVVLEWLDGKLNVRSSIENNSHLCDPLAAAGIYEIEELIIEEISPLPPSNKIIDPPSNQDKLTPPLKSAEANLEEKNPLSLKVLFKSSMCGLTFRAYWIKGEKGEIPAMGSSNRTSNFAKTLSDSDRGRLIQLAGFARKAEFVFQKDHGCYRLSEAQKIQNFIKKVLPLWKKSFQVILEKNVEPLLKGIQKVKIGANLALNSMGNMHLAWNLSLNGKNLDYEEIHRVRKKGTEAALVPHLGLVQIDKEENQFLNDWERMRSLNGNNFDNIPKYLLLSLFQQVSMQLKIDPKIEEWKDNLFTEHVFEKPLPKYLRDYQQEGIAWMNHLCECQCHGLLADDMGLGKTLQCLNLLNSRVVRGMPSLIICPASVVPVWQNEIAKFFPKWKPEILTKGNDFNTRKKVKIWISSYTQIRRHKGLLENISFGYAILDEAQVIKNPESKIAQACYSILAKHRFALTGTPIENKHLDLWSLFRFLMPGLLGNRYRFLRLSENNSPQFNESLRNQIKPFILRRTKIKVLKDLPPKVEISLICPMSEVQRIEYHNLVYKGVETLGEDMNEVIRKKSLNLFTLLTRLRQVSCDPGLIPGCDVPIEQSGKILALLDKIGDVLENNHKVVIFSQFVQFLRRIKTALKQDHPNISIYELNGTTLNREKPVNNFQQSKKASIMLTSLKAGGTGITLHNADYVFLMDPWWNPAVEEQAIDRVHRMGQNKNVFVYRMTTKGTIEEKIQNLKANKKELFNNVVGNLSKTPDFRKEFKCLSELLELIP